MSVIGRTTGATGDQLKALGATFDTVFPEATQSANDLAGGLATLAQRSGATGEQLQSLLEINSKVGHGHGQSLNPMINETQKLFVAWGVAVADQASKLDALLAISQKAGITFASLT